MAELSGDPSQCDLRELYVQLRELIGPVGHWWPMRRDRIEQAIGAILVQRTKWENAQVAIENLRTEGLIDAHALSKTPSPRLAELIRSAGFAKAKSRALPELAAWMREHEKHAEDWPDDELRSSLLSLYLVGPETADVIILYSYRRARFIADEYAWRLLTSRGFDIPRRYDGILKALAPAWEAANMTATEAAEFHGLIVEYGKQENKRRP